MEKEQDEYCEECEQYGCSSKYDCEKKQIKVTGEIDSEKIVRDETVYNKLSKVLNNQD